jgi:hypothetical protein
MPRYRVLQDGWTDDSGEHELGSTVELSRDTPAEAVEVDRLIAYGVIEPATQKTTSTSTTSSRKK